MGAKLLSYCGGIAEIKKPMSVGIGCQPDLLYVSTGLFSGVKIPYSTIINVSMKTDEQISKDVSLANLLLIGVLAFGAKKTTKEITNYMVIDYTDKGINTSAIFSGKDVPKVYSELLKARQKYLAANPSKPASAPTVDIYSEIEKLHGLMEKGIITDVEFSSKKQQLLGV